MRQAALVSALLALLLINPTFSARQGPPEKTRVKEIMQKKLEHSQDALAAIALADFARIARDGKALVRLSETAEWRVIRTPRYLRYSDEFQRAAEGMVKSARKKNLDGAVLSYVEMTLTCARCHDYIRETRGASLPPIRRTETAVAAGWPASD